MRDRKIRSGISGVAAVASRITKPTISATATAASTGRLETSANTATISDEVISAAPSTSAP